MNQAKLKKFIPVMEPDLSSLEEEYVMEAVRSGWISSIGSFVTRFEEEFARFCEVPHAVSVSNGTTALHLAMAVAGVGPGDEVIVPSLTFVATAAAVRHVGADPVFVDCDPEIGTMSATAVSCAITEKTKAIIPVHLYGHPVDIDPILMLAKDRSIIVIEDAAEAHGARYKGRLVGWLGDMATFSFFGNKILTTGEGGMVTTRNSRLADRLRILRDHAMDPKRRYWHSEVGFNFRITNLQAAIGCAQLARVQEIQKKRALVLSRYREFMEGELPLIVNPKRSWASPANWLVSAILTENVDSALRDKIYLFLRAEKIDSRPFFIPLHHMPPYRDFRVVGADGGDTLPISENLSSRGINLPSSGRLTHGDISNVILNLRKVLVLGAEISDLID